MSSNAFVHTIRVRYGETDAQKFLFNARYLDYADVAMTEFFRSLGWTYPQMLASRFDPSVVQTSLEFVQPVRLDDLVASGEIIVLARTKPDLIIDALTRQAGTFLAGVTTMFVKLTERLAELGDVKMPGLRLCISGGEPRNETVFSRWTDATGCAVHDVYAASECFPAVTYDPYKDPVPVRGSSGYVAPGSQMRVVDAEGHDVAPGTVGEALWKGPAHFLGYWRDEELTAKAVTADGWYRTGDLVRVDEQGYVFVEGRLSDMIIRGGSNVSPSEVEAVLGRHPSVRSAAVVGLPDPHYGEQIAAVVVLVEGHALDSEGLRTFCAEHLAGYKVPTSFAALDVLPTNSRTGKVDRRQLKADLVKAGVPA